METRTRQKAASTESSAVSLYKSTLWLGTIDRFRWLKSPLRTVPEGAPEPVRTLPDWTRTLGSMPRLLVWRPAADCPKAWAVGFTLGYRGGDDLVVADVLECSSAWKSGLRAGQHVISVDNAELKPSPDWLERYKVAACGDKGLPLSLTVSSGERTAKLTIPRDVNYQEGRGYGWPDPHNAIDRWLSTTSSEGK